MSINRRTFLKGSVATTAFGVAITAGLLKPTAALAAWPEQAFAAKSLDDALSTLLGSSSTKDGDIKIKAPDIAENGAVVPISVMTKMQNIKSINVFVEKNPQPLTASFDMLGNVETPVSTRIKMGETSDIIVVVNTPNGAFSARKTVKVTIGGCGG